MSYVSRHLGIMIYDLDTLAGHAGRDDLRLLGVHAPPLDLSSTYPIPDLDEATAELDHMAEGGRALRNPVYARLHNPTVARFEDALATLEGTGAAVAFGSGMAAVTACLLVARREGAHVVAVRPLYGGTDHLLASGILGLEATFVGAGGVRAALRPDTSLVMVETPANPTLALTDVRRIVEAADGVPVLVDSTFATPVLQRPVEQGAAMVLHSATKFLGGHGDVVGGIVATDEERARALRQVRALTGGILHPLAAFLLLRGLPTLPLRVRRAQSTARALADRLARHPAVRRVLYPGLPDQDPNHLVGAQMLGPGSVLSFELSGRPAAKRMVEALRLVTPAVSLGSTDTLIQHPASLTHRLVDAEALSKNGIREGLLRLSVGLEAFEDLWADLSHGLEAAERRPATEAPAADGALLRRPGSARISRSSR